MPLQAMINTSMVGNRILTKREGIILAGLLLLLRLSESLRGQESERQSS